MALCFSGERVAEGSLICVNIILRPLIKAVERIEPIHERVRGITNNL